MEKQRESALLLFALLLFCSSVLLLFCSLADGILSFFCASSRTFSDQSPFFADAPSPKRGRGALPVNLHAREH